MNKPFEKDYLYFSEETSVEECNRIAYVRDLEKYCDSLEKALEKACFTISGFEYVNAEDVKEWLMKDE